MMDTDTLVSIIVPVYNAGAYIEETLRMVERQTYENWELILVDDCSSDNSRELIRAYKGRAASTGSRQNIRLIELEKNSGAAVARNAGIDASAGRYIAFLDADDGWMRDKLQKELAFMKEKQAPFVFTAYEFGDEHGRGTGKVVHVPETLSYRKALTRTIIFTSTVLLDTEKTGKELIHMPVVASEDTALWWKLLRHGHKAYGMDQVLTIYRRPARSLSSNKFKAIWRIWCLYRKEERLSLLKSAYCLVLWAIRATLRRI